MKTLLKEYDGNRWYPVSIDKYRNQLKIAATFGDDYGYRVKSNIAYSLQYLEYIEKQLADLTLSSVLTTMLYKSYIVAGMGIVEALFTNLLKRTGHWNKTEWVSLGVIKSNETLISGKQIKVETELFEKSAFSDMRMDLDSMIKRIEKKGLLLIDHQNFPALKKLRQLRNRVHIQIGDDHLDHDYNRFNADEKNLMRSILYTLLTNEVFCNNPTDCSEFDFLK